MPRKLTKLEFIGEASKALALIYASISLPQIISSDSWAQGTRRQSANKSSKDIGFDETGLLIDLGFELEKAKQRKYIPKTIANKIHEKQRLLAELYTKYMQYLKK